MISKINVIILSTADLKSSLYNAEQQIANHLLKFTYVGKVLYVNSNYTLKDLVVNAKKAPIFRLLGLLPRYRKKNGLYTYFPLLSFNSKNLDYNKLIKRIVSANNKLKIENLVVLNFASPKLGIALNDQLNEIFKVYYRLDDSERLKYDFQYTTLVHNIFNQSQSEQLNISNSVDYEIYHKYYQAKRFNRIRTLLIGYVGEMNDNIDYNLLRYCILQIPNATFKFIGNVKSNKIYEFGKYSNVEIINTTDLNKIAIETNTLHLGLLPYVDVTLEHSINTSVYTYFSAGLSVISNNLLNFNYFKNNVTIAENKQDFEAAIRKNSTHLTSGKATIQTMSAKHVSWTAKVDEILKTIKDGIRQIH